MLMIFQLDYGGTERQVTEIAKGLDPSRFRPHVASFHPGPPYTLSEELGAAGVPVLHVPVKSLFGRSTLQSARMLGLYFRQHNIQLLHTFDPTTTLFGVPVARFYGVPHVLSSQRAHRDLAPKRYRKLLRVADRLVDGIVVNCDAMARHLMEDEGVPPDRIYRCGNSIDVERFRPEVAKPNSSQSEAVTIGCICVLRPEKDLATLLRAFHAVHRSLPSTKLLIVGDGPEREPLVRLSRELGIEDSCRFEPYQPRVEEWMTKLDIFVLPSRTEALSNSLMEAMACGRCVVASRVGGNPELVVSGQTGMIFEPGDQDGLVSCLRILVENRGLRERLAEAAVQFVRERYSKSAMTRQISEIYERVSSAGAYRQARPAAIATQVAAAPMASATRKADGK